MLIIYQCFETQNVCNQKASLRLMEFLCQIQIFEYSAVNKSRTMKNTLTFEMSQENRTPSDDPQDQEDEIQKLIQSKQKNNQSYLKQSEGVVMQKKQRLEQTIENCTEFKEQIDKRVTQVISDITGIKNDIANQREAKKSGSQFMTHDLDKYLHCFGAIDRDGLNHLFETDLGHWKAESKVLMDKKDEKMDQFRDMLEQQKEQIQKFWGNGIEEMSRSTQKNTFKPELKYLEVFGNPNQKLDRLFPTKEDLEKFPLNKVIKLKEICWKNNDVLMGIQFKFSNGIETPFFQKDYVANQKSEGQFCMKSQLIDQSRIIRKVSVKYGELNYYLYEMKLIDEHDQDIHHISWYGGQNYQWQTVEIPQGYEIIGLQTCLDEGRSNPIQAFGLIVWKPNELAVP